jgi:hypothetical protein
MSSAERASRPTFSAPDLADGLSGRLMAPVVSKDGPVSASCDPGVEAGRGLGIGTARCQQQSWLSTSSSSHPVREMRQQAVCQLNLGIFHGFSRPAAQLLSGF